MPIYRGVDGVNREIKSQFRGVEGVNRRIKEQYRVVDGVYRKVFTEGTEGPISIYTLNLDKLVGFYELYDYGTYLFIRINGRHIDGPTILNKVRCGWEIKGLQTGDEVEFSFEFKTVPTGDEYGDLCYYDGARTYNVVGSQNMNSRVIMTCAGNLIRVFQECGSAETYDKSTKITSILLNGNQIYPV